MSEDPAVKPETLRLSLSPVMDRKAVTQHLDELRKAFAQGTGVEIALEDVQQIGQAGLQLLISAIHTGRDRGTPVSFTGCGSIEPAIRLAAMVELFKGTEAATAGADA